MIAAGDWPSRASLAILSVTTKYAQPEELAESRRKVPQGLDPDEAALVERCFARGSRILDVGCGAGREAIALAKAGFHVTAIDLVPAMIELARAEATRQGMRVVFETKSVTDLDYSECAFDHVLFSPQVYGYIPSRQLRVETLRRVRHILSEEGIVVFSAYNRTGMRQGIRDRLRDRFRWLSKLVFQDHFGSEPGDRWVRAVSEASSHRSPACFCHFATVEEVTAEIRESGLCLNEITTFEELVEGIRLSSEEQQRIPTLVYIARRTPRADGP